MFTVLFTMIGAVVFVISVFKAGFKTAFKRLGGFIIAGAVVDIILMLTILVTALCHT